MKYATGNRINFVQFESQFSSELERFISEYAGVNSSKYHKALSLILQIYMRAGNTGGYYLSAEEDDILYDARKFNVSVGELKAIYDMATKRDLFDREQYMKNHIITNSTLQITFLSAKAKNTNWSMDGKHILDFVYKYYKSDSKFKKIADKLDKFNGRFKSKEQNGIEKNGNVLIDNDDMTLTEFKQLHPNKCITLPDDWVKPEGVKLKLISEAIKRSEKFLNVKAYMTLERLSTEFYDKVCGNYYDDSNFDNNQVKNEQKKQPAQNYSNRDYSNQDLNNLYDDINNIEL